MVYVDCCVVAEEKSMQNVLDTPAGDLYKSKLILVSACP